MTVRALPGKMCSAAILCATVLAMPAGADDLIDGTPEQMVRCAEIAFSLSVENQQPEDFKSLIHQDARFISAEVSRGPDEVMAAWAGFFATDGPQIRWRPQFIEVLDSGDLALSRGPYHVIAKTDSGEKTESWGIYNSVWQRDEDGQWRIVFDAGSPQGNTAPGEDVTRILDQAIDDCSVTKG